VAVAVVLASALASGLAARTQGADSKRDGQPDGKRVDNPAAPTKCAQDGAVAAPRGWQGWDRSSVVAWQAIEQAGGVVPEIEEDRTQSPPAWWRYPSAQKSALLLEAESRNATTGLYRRLEARELASGDVLLRTSGAVVGACGKMALVGANDDGKWVTVEVAADGHEPTRRTGSPLFFAADGKTPLPETRIFRIRVRKEDTVGHLRELRRDLDHLERTVGDRPPMLASGEGAVDVLAEKIHDLIDEGWSLVAEEAYDVDRREVTARALVLGAVLGWPGAAESAMALLEDVLRRAPGRPDSLVARATLAYLAGDAERALDDARAAIALEPVRPRPRWIEVRALESAGRRGEAEGALRRFRTLDPGDVRAARLESLWRTDAGKSSLEKAGAKEATASAKTGGGGTSGNGGADAIHYFATPEQAGLQSADLAFQISWPLTWRVAQVAAGPETGVLASLATGRVLLDDGQAERASAVILAQRPAGAAARTALLHSGVRKMFPAAKLKPLTPFLPGSRREQFVDKQTEGARAGEIVTLEKSGVVFFLVLNAPVDAYPKLRDEYELFVRSLVVKPAAPAPLHHPSAAPRPDQ
jgi:hypothetical protein